jgi:nifR3 family TIM-barrel protein
MSNFWGKLHTPFFVLAPMADVTDMAFRRVICKYSRHGEIGGGPDVFWTEFVSADGLASAGREVLKRDLEYTEAERPIVAQLFSAHPEQMREASKLCAELGFDGIDINMGCPDKSIEKQGAGACMIKNPESAALIIQAVKDGIADSGKNIPVSVKTRVGYNKVEINTWIPFLLEQDIAALTIHARTRKEMSLVPARWEHVKEVVEIRNKMGVKTKIIGNGDALNIEDAKNKIAETGCDGVMLGRAIFGNPWLFDHLTPTLSLARRGGNPTVEEKLKVMVEHTKLFEELLGDVKNFAIMKKHYKAYCNGFNGAKELRVKLMECDNARQIEALVANFISEC